MFDQPEFHSTVFHHRSAHSAQTDSAPSPITYFMWEIEHQAIVTQTIAPGRSGQVQFQGSWWTARCEQPLTLLPNQVVYVVARRNLTLFVKPEIRDAISA